jgi:hypothetical protein
LKDEIKTSTSFDNLMKKDANVVLKLTCLASNIKWRLVRVFAFFSLLKYENAP